MDITKEGFLGTRNTLFFLASHVISRGGNTWNSTLATIPMHKQLYYINNLSFSLSCKKFISSTWIKAGNNSEYKTHKTDLKHGILD